MVRVLPLLQRTAVMGVNLALFLIGKKFVCLNGNGMITGKAGGLTTITPLLLSATPADTGTGTGTRSKRKAAL